MTPEPGLAPDRTDYPARYRQSSSAEVRRIIAQAVLRPLANAHLGDITLLPHQRDAVARIARIIADHRGALLADEVGMGKTYVALGVARQYQSVQIIAPAALLPMWRTACARAAMPHARCHSLHAWAAVEVPPSFPGAHPALVIVDEAHHLRNPATKRYRRIAEALADCDVLLMSATPIHNRPRDLHALISLFRGNREDNLSPRVLSQLVVRRRQQDLDQPAKDQSEPTLASGLPIVRTHMPQPIPQDKETLSRILALPAPLPAHDGAVAGALIRLGLLRAWCSSDAQLAYALTKRRLRGEALHDALREGRHPTQEELRTWVVGDDAGQLAFPELLVAQGVESGPLIQILQRHLDAVGELARHHTRTANGDQIRAHHLRTLLETHPDVPIVAFSQYTHTVHALFRALSDIAGVGSVSGRRALIASGPLPREELLALFAPRAAGRPPPPHHLRIRLLLTTDLLAEGVNLQDAGVIVHLDLPWTHALRAQRVGRVVRMGSMHETVHVHRLKPERIVAHALRAEQRLAIKRRMGVQMIGADSDRVTHRSAADWRTTLIRQLRLWDAQPANDLASTAESTRIPLAVVRHKAAKALVALALVSCPGPDDNAVLLAIARNGKGWRVSRRASVISRVARRLEPSSTIDVSGHAEIELGVINHAGAINGVVAQWMKRSRIRALAGPNTDELPLVTQQVLHHLDRCHREWSALKRKQFEAHMAAARDCARRARGAAADAALGRWLRSFPNSPNDDRTTWIGAWQSEPALCVQPGPEGEPDHMLMTPQLAALLIAYPEAPRGYASI